MKNKELQFQLVENLDRAVALVESIVVTESPLRSDLENLRADLDNLIRIVIEVEKTEFGSTEDSMRKMKDSMEGLKKQLASVHDEPDTSMDILPKTESVFEPDPVIEPEPFSTPIPEPDLSEFITRPEDEPTSYVTSLTAMTQAKAGRQDMSQVAVSSTAMPGDTVNRKPEPPSDIFNRLKATGTGDQDALKSLVDRLKANKTVNDAYQTTYSEIRSSIGVNEKFLFVNDLFKGNTKEYTDMVQALEDAQTEEQMNQVVLPLREKLVWNEQSLAYITLMDVIRKKFGSIPPSAQN